MLRVSCFRIYSMVTCTTTENSNNICIKRATQSITIIRKKEIETIMSSNKIFSGVVACVSFVVLISAIALSTVGWMILNGPEVCVGNLYQFVRAETILYTINVAVFGLIFIISLFGMCFDFFSLVSIGGFVLMTVYVMLFSLINIAMFIWGVVRLSERTCTETSYFGLSIAFVVFNGLGMLSALCSRFNSNSSNSSSV